MINDLTSSHDTILFKLVVIDLFSAGDVDTGRSMLNSSISFTIRPITSVREEL